MDGSALYSDVCEIGVHGPQLAGKATAEALRHGGPSFNQSDYHDGFEGLVSRAVVLHVGKTDRQRMDADVAGIRSADSFLYLVEPFSAFWIRSLNF